MPQLNAPANERSYVLAKSWPRLWRTHAIQCAIISTVYALLTSIILATQISALRTDSIPDFHLWFSGLLTLSFIATIIWGTQSTKQFHVGVAGYKVKSPPISLLVATITLLWLPPFLYAYGANIALRTIAPEQVSGSSYLRLLRVATLFDAQTHYEPFPLQEPIPPLGSPDSFTREIIESASLSTLGAVENFAPSNGRRELLSITGKTIPECARNLGFISKAEAIQLHQQDFSKRTGQSDAELESIRRERAAELDRIEADYNIRLRKFRECLTKSLTDETIDREKLKQTLFTAERNAYTIYYANRGFGPRSSDYLQFISGSDFAAKGFLPLVGDLTIVASICWLIFFSSIVYRAMEFVDVMPTVRAMFTITISAAVLLVCFSLFRPAPSIPTPQTNPLILDTLASTLHWIALIYLTVLCSALGSATLNSSTSKSRALVLTAYLGLPLALQIETMNAINTLASTNYTSGNCPRPGWVVTDYIQCWTYYAWQPLIREIGSRLSVQFAWPSDYWNYAAARVSISIIISAVLSYLGSAAMLIVLEREYVRPRDQ